MPKKSVKPPVYQVPAILTLFIIIIGLVVVIALASVSQELRKSANVKLDYQSGGMTAPEMQTNCNPGATRCDGNALYTCTARTSEKSEICQNGCAQGQCLLKAESSSDASSPLEILPVLEESMIKEEDSEQKPVFVSPIPQQIAPQSETKDERKTVESVIQLVQPFQPTQQISEPTEKNEEKETNSRRTTVVDSSKSNGSKTTPVEIEPKEVPKKSTSIIDRIVQAVLNPLKSLFKSGKSSGKEK